MTDEHGGELSIEANPVGRNGAAVVTVRIGDDVIAADRLNLFSAKARAVFLVATCAGRPGIDIADLESRLLRLAAAMLKGA